MAGNIALNEAIVGEIFDAIDEVFGEVNESTFKPQELERAFYELVYTRRLPFSLTGSSLSQMGVVADSNFLNFLRQNLSGAWHDEVWREVRETDFGTIVSNGKFFARAAKSDVDRGHYTLRKSLYSQANNLGFVSRISRKLRQENDIFRLYFALKPSSAPWFLGELFDEFEDWALLESGKCLAHPRNYSRADAGVLYCYYSHRDQIFSKISELEIKHRTLEGFSPLGTTKIRKGISWADQPPSLSSSFGLWLSKFVVSFVSKSKEHPASIDDVKHEICNLDWIPRNFIN